MTSEIQMEWDHSSYQRKFLYTLAYVKVGDAPPSWRWIAAINDNREVYEDQRSKPIGQWVCQQGEGKVWLPLNKFPIVQFLYREIKPGMYRSKTEENWGYYLTKRHQKSYKIGLSDETHVTWRCGPTTPSTCRVAPDIDLDSPIMGDVSEKTWEVFNHKLVRIGTNLFADGDSIGFMEQGVCVVRSKHFIPLLKPYMGEKWQIES